eukprot:6635753-Alexandrium_andersonii.AAC.1
MASRRAPTATCAAPSLRTSARRGPLALHAMKCSGWRGPSRLMAPHSPCAARVVRSRHPRPH